jgi:hypothetical protein
VAKRPRQTLPERRESQPDTDERHVDGDQAPASKAEWFIEGIWHGDPTKPEPATHEVTEEQPRGDEEPAETGDWLTREPAGHDRHDWRRDEGRGNDEQRSDGNGRLANRPAGISHQPASRATRRG